MKKANLTAVIVGGLIVGGGGLALVLTKKKQTTAAPATGAPALTGSVGPTATTVSYPELATETAVQQKVLGAIQSNNPATMRSVASQLRSEGHTDAATSLEQYAASYETNQSVVNGALQSVSNVLAQAQPTVNVPAQPPNMPSMPLPPAQPAPQTPSPLPTAPPAPAPTTDVTLPGMTGPIQIPANLMTAAQALPSLLSSGTASAPAPTTGPTLITGSPSWPGVNDLTKMAVANAMNLNLASSAKGKENKTLVKQFQTQEAGQAGAIDGLYGPTVAKRLASQYGIVPPAPFYWSSKTPLANQKTTYIEFLSEMADKDPVRNDQWNAAIIAVG